MNTDELNWRKTCDQVRDVLAEAFRARMGFAQGSVSGQVCMKMERGVLYGDFSFQVPMDKAREDSESANDTAGCCPGIEEMRAALVSINAALDECLEVPANVLPAWNNVRAILRRLKDAAQDENTVLISEA